MADDDEIPLAKLCEVCEKIFAKNSYENGYPVWQNRGLGEFTTEEKLKFPQYHQSVGSLREAKTQGCFICSHVDIRDNDECERPEEDMKAYEFPLRYHISRGQGFPPAYELSIVEAARHIIKQSSIRVVIGFQIEPTSSSLSPEGLLMLARSQCRTWTGHNDVFALASSWLNNCRNRHPECSQLYMEGWKPTRLLDISEEGKVKLVEGKSVAAQQVYATLSHCWGTNEFLVLKSNNKLLFEEGIETSEFPLTFQETILTVRRLGLQYLWVDCYCIIQGRQDEKAQKDWATESHRMRDVYANSLLNIGALESHNPAGGLFRTRQYARKSRILWSPSEYNGINAYSISTRTYGRSHISWHCDHSRYMQSSHLKKRGWVLQEYVLAPRALSFGDEAIFWQCSQQATSNGLGESEGLHEHSRDEWRLQDPFWLLSNLDTAQPQRIKMKWIYTLHRYSQSALTYPETDIFAALYGAGSQLERLCGARYMDGMLSSALLDTLLYGNYSNGKSKRRDDLPTWHWASLYSNATFQSIRSLHDWVEYGVYGLFPMAYAFMSKDCKPLPIDPSGSLWPRLFVVARLTTKLPKSAEKRYDMRDRSDTAVTERELYIPIIGARRNTRTWTGRYLAGLVVVRSKDLQQPLAKSYTFRRVGMWHNTETREFSDDLDDLVEYLAKLPKARMVILE
ncbi:hypothetical protein O1611_g5530 [Lasiodiplodia mahajangana]|uniref:Uncharacterized protein n=1 Tax=Lasiodiplodia mahajangana TaxID=1108764 RepID=A0ACC2JKQ0_9PEZI|nr:hypothetical protein O1611_g5530 [Lasiodiplodia mahajangana]